MNKILLYIFLAFTFSCTSSNKDIMIEKSAKNCKCVYEIRDEFYSFQRKQGQTTYSHPSFDCDFNFSYHLYGRPKKDTFYYTDRLINLSKTKVYEVLIQKNEDDKVSYETFKIEPTMEIELGCNKKFKMNFWQGINLGITSEIVHKIHKVDLVSEY